MSLPVSQVTNTENLEMSDMASSLRRSQSQGPRLPASPSMASQSQVPISPASSSPTSLSQISGAPISLSLASPFSASQSLTAAEPAPNHTLVVAATEDAPLPRPDSSDRVSNSPTGLNRRQAPHDLYELSISPWVWEMISLFIAIGLLVAMVVIISEASNQPEQNWNRPITLSALVNTLSTAYRALLVYVSAEIVNQEKWIWFWSTSSAYRPLRHIQHFEAGSRGLLGALKLMPLVAKSSLESLLALVVIILSLSVGPFAQQSIGTDYRGTEKGIASLPVTYSVGYASGDFYLRTRTNADLIWWSLASSVRGALFSALANPRSNDSTIPVDCPTGNCEFPSWGSHGDSESTDIVTHASVGMCRLCHDVSPLVSMHEDSGSITYTLPNGMEITTFDSTPWLNIKSDYNLSWAQGAIAPDMAAQMSWSFTNTTVLTMGPSAGQDMTDPRIHPSAPVAVSCSLYPCLRTYSASIENSRLLERELTSTPLYPDLGNYTGADVESQVSRQSLVLPQSEINLAAIQSPCRINDTIFTTENMSTATGAAPVRILDPKNAPEYPTVMAPKECTFRIQSAAHLLLSAVYSQQFLNGNCTWDSRQGNEVECPESWWLAPFWETKTASVQSIKDRFSAIADATTNQFRLGIGREPNTTDKIQGSAKEEVAYTVFYWQWLLLPALLLVIDAVLLGCMLYRSIRHRYEEMPWKGNLLPLLYYRSHFETANGKTLDAHAGFGGEKDAGGPLLTATELEDASKQVFVRLRPGRLPLADQVEQGGD